MVYLTDGGIETDLIFNKGQTLPLFSAFVLNDTTQGREVIKQYYRDYLPVARDAGLPFLLTTDTWRASSNWADQLGYDPSALRRNNETAVELCGEMQDEFAAQSVVTRISGVLGPRLDAWVHDGAITVEEALSYHAPQIDTFAKAGVDEIAAITLTNTPEAIGIARAAKNAGLPVVLSFTVETDGTLPGGESLASAVERVDHETGGVPAFYMVSCAHPDHFAKVLMGDAVLAKRIGGLRANASTKSHVELDQSPDIDIGDIDGFGKAHRPLIAALPNLTVIGGCCGTDHRHIASLCRHCLSAAS